MFQRLPSVREAAFDPGRATISRVTRPPVLSSRLGSVQSYVQNRLQAVGGHGKRLIVKTNLPCEGPDCHDRHCQE